MNLNLMMTMCLPYFQLHLEKLFLVALLFFNWSAQSQQLETYITEAISKNSNIQAVEKQYAISTEKISEASTLSNTEFSGGYMVGKNDMPMMPYGEFSVMQMLPWFGTISVRNDYARAMADADYLEIEISKREIAMTLSQSYYRLYELSKKQEILDSNIQLLQVYEQMALTSIEVGQTSVVSVLRLQMRQNDLTERKLVLEQDYAAELTTFNKIIGRNEIADIAIADSLIVPEKDIDIDYAHLNLHPQLQKFEELNKVVSQAEALNKKESAPDLGVGVEYMLYNQTPNMLMPMVSFSVPIFNKKYKSVSKQNQLKQEELAIQKQASQNSLLVQLQAAVRGRNAARISLETQGENLKRVENATEILFKNYETGTIDFREVLEVQELQLNFQIHRIEAIRAYFHQVSIIDYFIKN